MLFARWFSSTAATAPVALACVCLTLLAAPSASANEAIGREAATRESVTREVVKRETAARALVERAPVARAVGPSEALVVGSSSMNQSLGHIITRELEQRGYRVTRKGVSAAGLARPDYRDMNQIVDELPISDDTAAVFVYLGMNDAQALWLEPRERRAFGRQFLPWSDARWEALYTRRARDFFERICQRGAQRTIVLLPVDVQRDRLQRRLKRIRALQAQAASSSSCAVALSTAGDLGRFEVSGVPMRLRDGLHMSFPGASAVWRRIQHQALRLVAASAPPSSSSSSSVASLVLGPWCDTPCRLGEGLRHRPDVLGPTLAENLGSAAEGFKPGPRCTSW